MSRSPSVNQASSPSAPGRLERVRRLVADAPAALLVEQAGEGVEDGVEVGRDVQAEDLEVVADVHDRRHLLGAGRARERVDEAGAAQAAAENGVGARLYAHRVLAIVPVKGLDGAKTRLAPRLSADERARLVVDMLDRVLSACAGAGRHRRNATRHARSGPRARRRRGARGRRHGPRGRDRARPGRPARGGRRARRHGRLPARRRRSRSTRWPALPARSRSPPPGTAASTRSRSPR